jgi:Helicase associated domain
LAISVSSIFAGNGNLKTTLSGNNGKKNSISTGGQSAVNGTAIPAFLFNSQSHIATTTQATPPEPTPPKKHFTFQERVQELEHFRKGNGHCRVPNGPGLGRWVSDTRRAHKDNKLQPEEVAVLDAMGFDWSVKEFVPWEVRFQELVKYKELHGHCNVSRGGKEDNSECTYLDCVLSATDNI